MFVAEILKTKGNAVFSIAPDLTVTQARSFYAILAAAMFIGLAISESGLDPIAALYWAAVINGVISVPVMVAVMIAASSKKVMGKMTLGTRWKVLGWIATAVMAVAAIALGVVSLS